MNTPTPQTVESAAQMYARQQSEALEDVEKREALDAENLATWEAAPESGARDLMLEAMQNPTPQPPPQPAIRKITTTDKNHGALLTLDATRLKDKDLGNTPLVFFKVEEDVVVTCDRFALVKIPKEATPFHDFPPGLYSVDRLRVKPGDYYVEKAPEGTGGYPDWTQALPSKEAQANPEAAPPFFLSAEILADLMDAAKRMTGAGIMITPPSRPDVGVMLTIQAKNGKHKAQALIMPTMPWED